MVQQKNIALCIVLSLVTCGIYGIYWFITLVNDGALYLVATLEVEAFKECRQRPQLQDVFVVCLDHFARLAVLRQS